MEVKYAGVKIQYILDPINKVKDRNYSVNTFIGSTGGNSVDYLSTNGTVLSFSSVVSKDELSVLSSYRNHSLLIVTLRRLTPIRLVYW